ncbi:DUF4402 domain-containing protein [Novosphingobium sp.]|uniref:DUF4402 domain-containing protein n=1 Tax=Novosphingobium sp. TaxID=1874826 RepID=UPI00262CDFA6|nr:DUF4402 domain-containing protein [Novosphingobium sp.]
MRNSLWFGIALAALTASPALAAGGNTATATGTATATVVAPLQITHTSGAALSFGMFTAGNGGTVSVSQAGAASVTGDIGLVTGGTVSADSFTISGGPSRTFTISTSTGNTVAVGGASRANMPLAVSAPTSGTLSSAGTFALKVGGTLTVAASQPAGSYTGTYTVTVTYQ